MALSYPEGNMNRARCGVGTTPMKPAQTNWRALAHMAARIPNPVYTSKAGYDVNPDHKKMLSHLCKKVLLATGVLITVAMVILLAYLTGAVIELQKKTALLEADLKREMVHIGLLGLLGQPENMALLGLLAHPVKGDLQEKRATWGQLALRLLGLLGHLVTGDLQATKKWRDDWQCGQGYPAEDGNPAECDPASINPCCSPGNWCGNTTAHCDCLACVDYRNTVVCPERYNQWRGTCYRAFTVHKTFSQAAATCRLDGGTLAMPRDADAYAFLISSYTCASGSFFWIGLNDQRQEGTFEWMDGTPLGNFRYETTT
ncbi:collectin-11-like [Branchiostoma floridae]|uniref:Collectin-11-like n=1 Tax=Branchiostoma floridae TaxID=7739 RepID=A0A9J7MEW5_BRAFL|nr:collectin-11-like [Branchiostoma floridae]